MQSILIHANGKRLVTAREKVNENLRSSRAFTSERSVKEKIMGQHLEVISGKEIYPTTHVHEKQLLAMARKQDPRDDPLYKSTMIDLNGIVLQTDFNKLHKARRIRPSHLYHRTKVMLGAEFFSPRIP